MDKKKRIIPCLDVKDGRLVKGINFEYLRDVGDPVEAAEYYEDAGADEIVFLDIAVSGRGVLLGPIEDIVEAINVPLIVGGGIRTIDDIRRVLDVGASKVSISSAAVEDPRLIADASSRFGKEKIVVAIDAKRRVDDSGWEVYVAGGRHNTGIDLIDWAGELEALGAGEILLTSMDRDGTNIGYDMNMTKVVTNSVNIPVIASGGAGKYEDFYEVLMGAGADAALAASVFHYREIEIEKLKEYLEGKEMSVY